MGYSLAQTVRGEIRHFTNDPAHAEILAELRAAFDEEWFPDSGK